MTITPHNSKMSTSTIDKFKSTIFKTFKDSLYDISIVGRTLTEINSLKLDATNISGYVTALKGLSTQQAQLVMSTKGLTTAQQQAVLSQISLANATGTLTTSQMTSALITETRNEADAKALLLNAGLITSETAEATATHTVTVAKLKELVATGQLTQAEAQLLATKVGVTSINQKQASSFSKLGTSLKDIGNSIKSIAINHPVLTAITVVIGAITTAITIAEKKNEEFIESQKELIEKIDENISKYDEEISSLDSLQEKLQNAKGDKEALASIQSELNQAIGDTPGLLNEESNAYDIANQKIDDRIERLKELRKLELEDKVTAQKEIFNNTLVDNAMGIDHKFDYFSNHKIIASDTLGSEFSGYLEGINANRFETLQSIFEALKKNGYGNGEKSNAEIWKELIDSYGGAMLDVEEIQNYFDNQTEYAQKILSDYVNNAESIFSKEELNSIIANLVEGGYAQDLEGITDIITSLVENDELKTTINDYYESLYNDDVDSDALYQNIKGQFDTLVANYPELKGILDNYFNSIGKDIETGINNVSSNPDEITGLSDYLNQDNDEIQKTKEALYELARAGEIDENTFNSTKEYRKILSDLGITSEEAARQLLMMNDLQMDMSDWQTQLDNARSTVSELQGIIDEINDKGISSSSVDKLTTDYPQLLRYLGNTPTLLKEINKLIDEQSESAQKAGTMLIEYNADAYNQIKSVAETTFYQIQTSHDGQITSLANMYKIDLDNYSSLAQAKKEIEFLLLGDLNQGWADHFGIVIDSFTGMAKATENLGDYYNNSENQKKVADYNRLIAELNKARERFNGNVNLGDYGTDSKSSGSKADKHLEEYKTKLSMLEDQLDQQLITEREFFDKSEALLNQYLKDSPEHIEKYAEEISNAEKALHDNWIEAYEAEAEELGRFRDKNLIDMAEYYQSMMSLQDEYYNSEALKLTQLADKMEAEYGRMNSINLTRPTVTATDMQSAGYTTIENDSSTHAMTFGNENKQVVVTPVLPDGTILSPTALTDYASKLLAGQKIDANIELAMFEGDDAVKQATEYVKGLETVQGEYAKLKDTFSENPYGNFTDEQLEAMEKLTEELDNVMSELSGELGGIKSAYDNLIEIRDTYNEYGKISVDQYQNLCDMGFQYLALLSNESGALALDEAAFQRLTDAKVQEMQVTLALQAADLINNIYTEADAIQYLASSYSNLATQAINAAEAMLYAAQANAAKTYGANSLQAQAANTIVKGYQNTKLLAGSIGAVDIKMQSGGGYQKPETPEKEEKKFNETLDWIEKFLENLSKKTEKLLDKVDKFISWQKKNSMINRAITSTDKEIAQNQVAYHGYMNKANKVGLNASYIKKIQNGSLDIEDITDEALNDKITEYMEWYDKAQGCLDTVEELYEQQRDLIRQKLDNVLNYYSDMDSYLSSITAKIESLISLNDQMGKRSSLTELVEQFASLNKQIESVTAKGDAVEVVKKKIASGTAESVKKAVADDNAKEANRIQGEIDNLDVTQSGTYQKLLKDIEKTQAKIAQYEDKGWDTKKAKQYEKLQKKLENYYAQQKALDDNATSNTVANYSKVYLAWQKLMDNTSYQKLLAKESDGTLTASEQKKLDKYNKQLAGYETQMEKIKNDGQSEIDALLNQLSVINGTAQNTTEAQKIQKQINDIEDNLQNTAIYQNLVRNIEDAQNKIAELDAIGYDNLTKKQKKTYDKLTATLESYYAQKESLDQGATASNIAEYNKIYLAWKKLQDKLDSGKNLSTSEWQKYDSYTKQLENWIDEKATQYEELNSQLQDALNPPDKQGVIKKEYEESSKQMYDSYQNQIDAINSEVRNTQNYKNLLANMRKLEQKKDTKGLSKAEEDKLKKYQAELDALEKGGTATNVADYMKTWEAWYKLQQKLDNGKNLSTSEASKYDEYRAKLEAWNKEKQTQINDLLSLMEDDLEKLNKTYTENVSEAESEIEDYYANLYSLAKQIAEYNINALEQQLSVIQSMVSYYQNLAGLYETFSGDKLSCLLVDLDEDEALSKLEIYQKELSSLNEQYDTNKKKIKEYQQLLDALDTNNFESSMALFNKVLNDSSVSQSTKDNLQQVIDLLNERALSADNWGEYADQWKNEWQQALAETKQSLIEVAGSIQEVNDAIRETSFESLTDAITQLGYLKDTLSSITGLINDDWIFDDDSELTEYGNAKVSLLVEQMQTAREEADKYAQQISAIMSMRDTYSSENAYQTALQEAKSNYLSSLNELKSFEDSVVSIMTQSNESIVNSLKDVISARIKALKAQKDLYEYNKSITNSQKEIDSIKAQIDALENLTGATDAATKAKLAQLKADLEEKETALKDMKDDHTYNLQITALEEFMDTLDKTMSDAADAVNKSFAAYKEAIDSALKVYEENKDYLGEWSNTIMRNTLGLANTGGTNTIDVNVQQSGSGESKNNLPTIEVVNSDTTSAVKSSSETLHGDLIDIKTAIEQGIIVKVDSPLTAINPEMMNFVRNYVPPMTNAVVNTLPQIAERKATQPVIQNHYDCLLKVEGNVDKDFAKVLPKHLEEAYQYTTKKLYRELNILK